MSNVSPLLRCEAEIGGAFGVGQTDLLASQDGCGERASERMETG